MIDKDLVWLINLFASQQTICELYSFLDEEVDEIWEASSVPSVVKELADTVWCAIACIEKLGYDTNKVLDLLFHNNLSKLAKIPSNLTPVPDGCAVQPLGEGFFALVGAGNKIVKPASFKKLTALDIDNCRYDNDTST